MNRPLLHYHLSKSTFCLSVKNYEYYVFIENNSLNKIRKKVDKHDKSRNV